MAKKKLALKAVPRGFATVSIPKKKVSSENIENLEIIKASVEEITTEQSIESKLDPEQIELDKLQSYVEKLTPKVEREVSRIMSAFDYERRISKSYTTFVIPSTLQDEIIAYAAQHAKTKYELNRNKPSRQWTPLDNSEKEENKLLSKLAITHNVLQRLSFSDERIAQCLDEIPSPNLNDAMTWMCLNCPNEEFWSAINTVKKYVAPIFVAAKQTPGSGKQSRIVSRRNSVVGFPTSPSTRQTLSRRGSFERDMDKDHSELKAKILELAITQASSEEDVCDPTAEHVRKSLLVHQFSESGNGKKREKHVCDDSSEMEDIKLEKITQLKSDIKVLEGHLDFDAEKASMDLKNEIKSLRHTKLLQKLENTTQVTRCDERVSDPVLPNEVHISDSEVDSSSICGIDSLEALFEDPDTKDFNMESQNEITMLELTIPSNYSGRLPTFILSDIANKLDKYSTVTFKSLWQSPHSSRVGVTLTFGDADLPSITIQMTDVSARSELVAKNYVATLVLHQLWVLNKSRSIFQPRSLALDFRELWNDLEDQDFQRSQQELRARWKVLLQIYEAKPKVANIPMTIQNLEFDSKIQVDLDLNPSTAFQNGPSLTQSFLERLMLPSYQNMLLVRNKLPIATFRQDIVNSLERNQVLVLSGETGCGKSTQLPSFLLEHELLTGNHCNILVTEPRRISAISLAQRVSQELGESPDSLGKGGSLVGYSVRLDNKTCKSTRLTFATNGIALRMLESKKESESGFANLTHIILDEVHERNLESDFLLIVLKELILVRPNLKVVLMSATIESEKLSKYFGGCPILTVPGRTYPVEVHYLEDAIELTDWNLDENSSLAKKTDRNGVLQGSNDPDAFAWYENEGVNDLNSDEDTVSEEILQTGTAKTYNQKTVKTLGILDEKQIPYPLIIKLLEHVYFPYSKAILIFLSGLAEIRKVHDLLQEHPLFGGPSFRIYPLHSSISNEQQSQVFNIPPLGIRKIVISTNIAETGITIPDCTAVIDAGRHREMRFDEKRQISRLVETFIAKSNAAQRRGRAGRVQNGICFHLFTKVRYETRLAAHPIPEIMRLSLQDLALRIKILKIKLGSSIEDTLSRALDPPAPINIQRAVSSLVEAQALDIDEQITPLGEMLSRLPTDVGLGKFLLFSVIFKCVDPALTIASCLNSKSPFIKPFGQEAQADRKRMAFSTGDSDFLTIHNAYSCWRRCAPGFVKTFCTRNFLSHQTFLQIEDLRSQLFTYLIDTGLVKSNISEIAKNSSRGRSQATHVPEELNVNSSNAFVINAVLSAGLYPKLLQIDPITLALKTIGKSNSAVWIHPSSVLHRVDLIKNSSTLYWNYFSLLHSKKLYAHEVGPVSPLALILLCGDFDPHFGSDFLSIGLDKRLRFFADPKLSVTMNIIRKEISSYISFIINGKDVSPEKQEFFDLGVRILRCGHGVDSIERGNE